MNLLRLFILAYITDALLLLLWALTEALRLDIHLLPLPSLRFAIEASKKYRILALFLGKREVRISTEGT